MLLFCPFHTVCTHDICYSADIQRRPTCSISASVSFHSKRPLTSSVWEDFQSYTAASPRRMKNQWSGLHWNTTCSSIKQLCRMSHSICSTLAFSSKATAVKHANSNPFILPWQQHHVIQMYVSFKGLKYAVSASILIKLKWIPHTFSLGKYVLCCVFNWKNKYVTKLPFTSCTQKKKKL